MNLPKISIVVPNYNSGAYIEATIQSVLDQDYGNKELIVIDGGSSDNSVDVIKRYEKHLAYWESQRDRGQSDAINKGLLRTTGQYVNWLCSDDMLAPGCLKAIATAASEGQPDIVAGQSIWQFEDRSRPDVIMGPKESDIQRIPFTNPIQQPSCFFQRSLLRSLPVRVDLHYAMDAELWAYFKSIGAKWQVLDDVLSVYRMTGENKSAHGGLKAWAEWKQIYADYADMRTRASIPIIEYFRGPVQHYAAQQGRSLLASALFRVDRSVATIVNWACGSGAGEIASMFHWMYGQHIEAKGR